MFYIVSCFVILAACSALPRSEEPSEDLRCYQRNEISSCVYDCPPERTCSNRGIQYKCLRTENQACTHKCVCEEGYYRNKAGQCITGDDCDKCTGSHEYFSCGSACDNECDKLHTQNQTNCPIASYVCNQKCYCEEGYARNDNNECVPIDQCKNKCTGSHEYFSCGSACDNECDKLHTQNQTNCPIVNIKCNQKCYCEEGYARNEYNECVPIDQCKNKCTGRADTRKLISKKGGKFKKNSCGITTVRRNK